MKHKKRRVAPGVLTSYSSFAMVAVGGGGAAQKRSAGCSRLGDGPEGSWYVCLKSC